MAQPQYGMFGPLPWEVQQMQDQQFEQAAIQRAQLSAGDHNTVMSAIGGRALGQGIAGAFGIEDPAMARSKQMQAISKEVRDSGIDPSNFEQYYTKLGEGLAKAGLMREAASVADALQSYRDKQASLETKKFDAETARIKAEAFRSSKLRSPIAQEIFKKNKEYAPKSLQKYLDSITPEKPDGDMSVLEPYNENLGEWEPTGFTPDKKFVFTNKAGQAGVMGPDGKIILYHGDVDKAVKGGTSVTVNTPDMKFQNIVEAPKQGMSPADQEALAQVSHPRAKKMADGMAAMESLEPIVNQALQAVESKDFAWGTGSGLQTELLRARATAANWLGIKVDNTKLNNTDTLKQYTARAILPLLAQIGGNDSNEEMQQMMRAVGDGSMTPEQFKRAIEITKKEINLFKERQGRFVSGLASGRTDTATFFANNYQWPKGERIQFQTEKGGTNKTITEVKGDPAAVRSEIDKGLPTAPQNLTPPESLISKYQSRFPNLSREQIIKKLIESEKGR